MDEIDFLLCWQSLAKWPSVLEVMCGGSEVLKKDLYSMITYELLHKLHSGV